ncbi:hypothetical protein AB0L13_22990 [Saccharopolyspora shandongensis]|uniref:hypothetical protein n=1 Tax=Saccharopolyspora shandongensis TaxID=418495 RepID=UPI00344719E9
MTLQRVGIIPGEQLSLGMLLLAVAVGALPVVALLLDRVTSFKGPGLEVAFAAVQEAVQTAETVTVRTTIADNLGARPGVLVTDSAGDTIIEALRAGVIGDVAIVDLGDGHEWWQTRLLLLTAGAVRRGHPRAIAFTATLAGKPQQYLGWGVPAELLQNHLRRSTQLRQAYRRARRDMLLVDLADTNQGGRLSLPWPSAGHARKPKYANGTDKDELLSQLADDDPLGDLLLPWPRPEPASPPWIRDVDDAFLTERLLLNKLQPLEDSMRDELDVTAPRARDLFAPVLHDESVGKEASEDEWLRAVLDGTTDYIAITDHGQYVNLITRDAAVNAVLRSLVGEHARSTRKRAGEGISGGTAGG